MELVSPVFQALMLSVTRQALTPWDAGGDEGGGLDGGVLDGAAGELDGAAGELDGAAGDEDPVPLTR
ncbi:hypothetical protein GCM10017581_099050 [Dactylosporangium matsuzakiense]|uniref:Uncharacterized protein n=1 Tax=Dactylosporangium matsuzakiense TaxID=53360 RepID=A0A9W6KVW9_9ACTN|nr:hypothetical protein GCM10017581_099050 [Dactylosporangium matsuzakiense]